MKIVASPNLIFEDDWLNKLIYSRKVKNSNTCIDVLRTRIPNMWTAWAYLRKGLGISGLQKIQLRSPADPSKAVEHVEAAEDSYLTHYRRNCEKLRNLSHDSNRRKPPTRQD